MHSFFISGNVTFASVKTDEKGRSRGFGTVRFETQHDAQMAISILWLEEAGWGGGGGKYRSFIFECGAGFCLHIKIFFCDHDVILAFRNPCALIRFKSDSRLSALHSGRWVDKLVSMWASRSGTLSQSSPQVVKVCINLDNHVSKPIHCEQNISIMWMPRSSKWQKMEWRDPWHALRKSLFLCDYWTKSDGVFTDMIKVHYLHNFSFLPVLGIPQLVNISSIGLLSFRKTYL